MFHLGPSRLQWASRCTRCEGAFKRQRVDTACRWKSSRNSNICFSQGNQGEPGVGVKVKNLPWYLMYLDKKINSWTHRCLQQIGCVWLYFSSLQGPPGAQGSTGLPGPAGPPGATVGIPINHSFYCEKNCFHAFLLHWNDCLWAWNCVCSYRCIHFSPAGSAGPHRIVRTGGEYTFLNWRLSECFKPKALQL